MLECHPASRPAMRLFVVSRDEAMSVSFGDMFSTLLGSKFEDICPDTSFRECASGREYILLFAPWHCPRSPDRECYSTDTEDSGVNSVICNHEKGGLKDEGRKGSLRKGPGLLATNGRLYVAPEIHPLPSSHTWRALYQR